MFYLGNDQHARQITICLRDESGDVVERRQVSTEPDKIRDYLEDLRERTATDGGYMAILEVCGFNDWYVDLLKEMGCRDVILVQPEDRSSRKTDRRDAAQLSEQLWMNRLRIAEGKRIQGLRRVVLPEREDVSLRKLTQRRCSRSRQRGRVLVRIKTLVRRSTKRPVRRSCSASDRRSSIARVRSCQWAGSASHCGRFAAKVQVRIWAMRLASVSMSPSVWSA